MAMTEEQKDQFMNSIVPNQTILHCTIGYSMILPNFFLVLKKTKRTLTLIKLQTKFTQDDGYGQKGECVPVMKPERGEQPFTKRLSKYGMAYKNRYALDIWDGKPKAFDTYD